MKVALTSIVFALLETTAIAASLRKLPSDGPAPAEGLTVSLVDNGNKQQGKRQRGKPPDPPVQVQSFTISSIENRQQGKAQEKKKVDNHLPSHLNNDYDASIVGGSSSPNPAQVHQSFTVSSIDNPQQGKAQGKNKNDNHLPSHLKNDYDTSIVGGQQSDVGEFPYYVDLNGCGGSLIAPNVVLTAAHCEAYESFVGKNALVGAYRRQNTSNGAVWVNIEKATAHPQYDSKTTNNDFLLLKLSQSVDISNILSLNFDGAVPVTGEDLTVLGVGTTSQGGSQASHLMDVVVDAVSTNQCNDDYGGLITDEMFCAGKFIECTLSV
jgi:trypsin